MALNRSMYPVLLNENAMYGRESDTLALVRVDKSTLGEMSDSVQTETRGYIDSANDSTEVTGHQLTQPQEIILDEKNRCFRAVDYYFKRFGTGSDAIVPAYQGFPSYDEDGVLDKTRFSALVWEEATLYVTSLNFVDKKYSMTINYNGDPKQGYLTKNDDGTFNFTEDDTATLPPEIDTQSLKATKSTKLSDE